MITVLVSCLSTYINSDVPLVPQFEHWCFHTTSACQWNPQIKVGLLYYKSLQWVNGDGSGYISTRNTTLKMTWTNLRISRTTLNSNQHFLYRNRFRSSIRHCRLFNSSAMVIKEVIIIYYLFLNCFPLFFKNIFYLDLNTLHTISICKFFV